MLVVACLPLAMVGLLFALSTIGEISLNMTSDDWWGLLIVAIGFGFVALLVEGASS